MARTPVESARATLTADIAALRDALNRHLAHEERSAMALIQRYLDAGAWERLEKEVLSKAYPATAMIDLLPWVVDDVPAHLRSRLLGSGGRLLRALVAVLQIRYARTCRPAFRYATGSTASAGPSAG
jgi:hypothetical protein